MIRENTDNNSARRADDLPAADTGNASNPSAGSEERRSPGSQLLDEKAERYMREVANIEDVPDAQDQKDMDKTIDREKEE